MPQTEASAPFLTLGGANSSLLVVCDHASNRIPGELADLGLAPRQLRDHIALDIGAAGVAIDLARRLECPAFLGGWSRLVADLNRHPDSPEVMLVESDGQVVPGNLRVAEDERQRRLECYYFPYHRAIERHLEGLRGEGIEPALVSIHSYTPELWSLPRPWLLGLLWRQRGPHIDALLDWFTSRGLEIGDNQPYDGHYAMGHTLERHGERRGLRHVLIELRQDQVYTPQLQKIWGQRIAQALRETGLCGPDVVA